jgi:hypothetical protein
MKLPPGLKRHIANYIRFISACVAIAFGAGVGQRLGILEHDRLVLAGLIAIYLLVTAWFVWRGYTGMVRDLDFYDDDFR